MSEQPPQDPYGQDPAGQPPGGPPPGQPPGPPPYGQQPPPGQPPGEPPYGQQPPPGYPPQDPSQGGWSQGQNQGWGQDQGYGQPPPNYPAPGAGPGGTSPYSATDAIGYGFSKFKDNAGAFIVLALLAVGASIAISIVGSIVSDGASIIAFDSEGFEFSLVAFLFNLLAQLVGTLFTAAAIRGALDAVEGREVNVGDMFQRWDKVQVVIAAIIISILSSIGFVLCVLPGVFVVFATWFTSFFIVDRGLDAISALRSSFRFTMDHFGALALLALLCVLCLVAGAIACLVGLLVAYPTVMIASAYSFKRLQDQPVAP
jgi:hypothetical protein